MPETAHPRNSRVAELRLADERWVASALAADFDAAEHAELARGIELLRRLAER